MVNQKLAIPDNLRELWLRYFDDAGFKYTIKDEVEPYYHPDLDDLLAWYEGTTHGVVKRADLTADNLRILKQKYPGELHIHHPTLRLVGFKPG